MTPEELIALWGKKMTTEEEFQTAYDATPEARSLERASQAHVIAVYGGQIDRPWWLRRDMMRQAVGVYEPATDVLLAIRTQFGQHFPHISRENREQVAYMPDLQAALADKKQTTPIGRLLRRWYMGHTDEEIKQLETSHRAELSNEYLIATTPEEMLHVYQSMLGDGGCMRYDPVRWHIDIHPTAAYHNVPGLRIAYTTNADGINSRSLIYDNPDDPADKRYVRVYGDMVLKKRLMRDGYRKAGLVGVKIRAIPAEDHYVAGVPPDGTSRSNYLSPPLAGKFILPYIDRPGGPHGADSGGEDKRVAGMIRYENDPGWIHLLDFETKLKLQAVVNPAEHEQQDGNQSVPMLSESDYLFTCLLTGDKLNKFEVEVVHVYKDGVFGATTKQHLKQAIPSALHLLKWNASSQRFQNIYLSSEDYTAHCLANTGYFDDDATAERKGYIRFSEEYYPGRGRMYATPGSSVNIPETAYKRVDGVWVEVTGRVWRSDTFKVYDVDGVSRYVHNSLFDQFKADNIWVKCAKLAKKEVFCHKGYANLVVMKRSRMKAIHGVHKLVKLNGEWEFTKNVVTDEIFGFSVSYHRNDQLTALPQATIDRANEEYEYCETEQDVLATADSRIARTVQLSGSYYSKAYGIREDGTERFTYISDMTYKEKRRGAEAILLMTPDQLTDKFTNQYNRGSAETNVKLAKLIVDYCTRGVDVQLQRVRDKLAAASEAAPQPVEVVQDAPSPTLTAQVTLDMQTGQATYQETVQHAVPRPVDWVAEPWALDAPPRSDADRVAWPLSRGATEVAVTRTPVETTNVHHRPQVAQLTQVEQANEAALQADARAAAQDRYQRAVVQALEEGMVPAMATLATAQLVELINQPSAEPFISPVHQPSTEHQE